MAERNETKEAAFFRRHPIWATVIAGLIVALISSAITYILPKAAEKANNNQVKTIVSETSNTIPNSDMATEEEEDNDKFNLRNVIIFSCFDAIIWMVLLFWTSYKFEHFYDKELAGKIAGVISSIIVIGLVIVYARSQLIGQLIDQLIDKLCNLF